MSTGERDEQALAEEALRVLGAERASAGADPTLAHEPVSMLAYGLGARPVGADLSSLEDLLGDLGLAGESTNCERSSTTSSPRDPPGLT